MRTSPAQTTSNFFSFLSTSRTTQIAILLILFLATTRTTQIDFLATSPSRDPDSRVFSNTPSPTQSEPEFSATPTHNLRSDFVLAGFFGWKLQDKPMKPLQRVKENSTFWRNMTNTPVKSIRVHAQMSQGIS